MSKILKPGRVVVILAGRFAGKKAVVIRSHEAGHGDHKFGHVVVAGISKYPRKVTRAMEASDKKRGTKRVATRRQVKTFVKAINYRHVMPTRYVSDIQDSLKATIDDATLLDEEKKVSMVRKVQGVFTAKVAKPTEGKSDKAITGNAYLFRRLRF